MVFGSCKKANIVDPVQVVLGHSQPQTTARYAHLDADPLLRAANLIGERIENAMNPPVVTTSAEA